MYNMISRSAEFVARTMAMAGGLVLIVVEVGLNLFIINSMAKDIPIGQTYRGAIPFVVTDVTRVAILATFPAITLWLVWLVY